MMQFHRSSRLWFTVFGLILLVTACEEEAKDDQVGSLVGSWQLTDLSVDWVRDVASPEGTAPDTIYTLTASWDAAFDILGSDSAEADQILTTFAVGDTILDTTVVLNATWLALMQISMTATFNEDFRYILAGTYPALRLIPDSCITELAIPQISDAGLYDVDYITGRLGIRPGEFDQVLPSFDDGQIAFSDNGKFLTISYVDRDGHDQRIAETGETWDEVENRVIHGAAELPVNIVTGAFSQDGWLRQSGYIMDYKFGAWGSYLTLYALVVQAEIEYLFTAQIVTADLNGDDAIDEKDAITYIFQNRDTGMSQFDVPYSLLISAAGDLTNDSGRDFDPAVIQAGGKLTYVINPVCVPVNEIIYFETTWSKVD
jgi:hypothetical protein